MLSRPQSIRASSQWCAGEVSRTSPLKRREKAPTCLFAIFCDVNFPIKPRYRPDGSGRKTGERCIYFFFFFFLFLATLLSLWELSCLSRDGTLSGLCEGAAGVIHNSYARPSTSARTRSGKILGSAKLHTKNFLNRVYEKNRIRGRKASQNLRGIVARALIKQ